MGALVLSNPVEPTANLRTFSTVSSHQRRSGPVVGGRARVSRLDCSGKFACNIGNSSPDENLASSSSIPPPPNDIQDVQMNLPSTISSELRIYYQNVRGLRTKLDDFFLAAVDSAYDVVVLTETWLDDCILSPQLFGSAFTVFRMDRNPLNSRKTRGGGVLIAVSSKFCCYIDPAPVSNVLEQLWVKIKLPSYAVSVGVLYLPPDRRSDMFLIQQHIDSIDSIRSGLQLNDIALLFGDYNHPEMHWIPSVDGGLTIDPCRSRLTVAGSTLYDAFNFHGLTQVNDVENSSSRTLDLVLVNEVALPICQISEATEPLVEIDVAHPAVDVCISASLPATCDLSLDFYQFDFRRADYDLLNQALSLIDWQFMDSGRDINDIVEMFNAKIRQVIDTYVPRQRPPLKPPWTTSYLRLLKRRRQSALRKYSRNRSPHTKRRFAVASNRYKRFNRISYGRYVERTQRNLRRHPKQFWSFVRTKRKVNGLPTSMYFGHRSVDTASDKCELFAEHFKNAFSDTLVPPSRIDAATRDTPTDSFDFGIFHITEEHIQNALRKLKYSVSAGPDGIPSSMLKKCSNALLIPLLKLFNLSLQCKAFPAGWKTSFMSPIHKKGDKCNIANYRGITSLSACSKLFELIVNNALFESCKNYISSDQHGFYKKRSVTTNLVPFISLCVRSMDTGKQVDTVYTDFKAAFDRVNHDILLQKLRKLGVSTDLVSWFRSYLTDRTVKVRIGPSQSDAFSIRSGVPQGSNLGPLLFSLFINDIAFILPPGQRVFYADDVKIFMTISSTEDCLELQRLLDLFVDWSKRNILELCIAKCTTISFSRKRQPVIFNYRLSGQTLERLDQVRDLGVILDSELTFRPHCEEIIAKSNKQLGFMFKVADGFRDPHCLKSLYCALVRSILESAVLVWCPYNRNWIDRIEAVQKKFVRLALRHLPWRDPTILPPYEHRCMLLGIDTLENRRRHMQAVFIAKVLTHEIDAPSILAELNMYVPARPLRQRSFLHLAARNSRYGQHDPIRFMSSRFNDAFEHFDFNVSAATFQGHLNAHR